MEQPTLKSSQARGTLLVARFWLLLVFEVFVIAYMGYLALFSVIYIVWTRDLFTLLYILPFTAPHAYPIVIWFLFFAAFYRKFGWKTAFVFALALGANGMIFDFSYLVYHLPELAASGWTAWPLQGWVYPLKLFVYDVLPFALGYLVVRPKFRLSRWTGYVPLAVFLLGYAYVFTIGFPVTLHPFSNFYDPVLNLIDFTGLVSLPLLIYSSIQGRVSSTIPIFVRMFEHPGDTSTKGP